MTCAIESFIHFLQIKQNNDASTIVNIIAPNSKNNNFKFEGEIVKILESDSITWLLDGINQLVVD